jgi:membrane associated rhomboid family serine protease
MIPLYGDLPTRRPPIVTILIIVLNAFVFVGWQLPEVDRSVAIAGFVPEVFTDHQPGGVTHMITSMFMHAGWMHLIGNMWFLWIFGKNVEDVCGHFGFAAFYLLCGAAAAIFFALGSPHSEIPLVGASGAISGVLGAFLLKFPKAKVRALVPLGFFSRIMDVPAFIFLLIWIGIQIFNEASARGSGRGSGVAYMAHIGGFIAGCVLIFIFQGSSSSDRPPAPDEWWRDQDR